MLGGLVGQRGDVQPTQADVCTLHTVAVCDLIGAVGRSDVDLDHHQVRLVAQLQFLDMFVLDLNLIIRVEVTGQRCQSKRWKQRVLDGAPERALGFGQGGKDHLDLHRLASLSVRPGGAKMT